MATMRKVLFICPQFFGYHLKIINAFEQKGASVDWFDDRPNNSGWAKALLRLSPSLMRWMSNRYFQKVLMQAKHRTYDLVFFVKAESISTKQLQALRKSQKQAKFIYYTWDSIRNVKNAKQILRLFDKAFSFDLADCETNKALVHLPLFFSTQDDEPSKTFDYDLVFLASFHSDRFLVWQRLQQCFTGQGLRIFSYLYFQSKVIFYFSRLVYSNFRATNPKEVHWVPMDNSDAVGIMKRGRILIDIHNAQQTGLTMRMIESIGLQRKTITTNPWVKKYDFYNPINILVIDRSHPVVPKEFLQSNYQAIDESIRNHYSLNHWASMILAEIG